MIIKETKNYELNLGSSSESSNLCYRIKNKSYGVVEIETYLLPQALKHINELQAALDAISDPTFFKA